VLLIGVLLPTSPALAPAAAVVAAAIGALATTVPLEAGAVVAAAAAAVVATGALVVLRAGAVVAAGAGGLVLVLPAEGAGVGAGPQADNSKLNTISKKRASLTKGSFFTTISFSFGLCSPKFSIKKKPNCSGGATCSYI
jgi:dihydroxyacetone kinase-like predicted kinase